MVSCRSSEDYSNMHLINRRLLLSRVSALLSAFVMMALASGTATAQSCQYSFSQYNDVYASSDLSTIYTSATVYDYSNCNHSQYNTTSSLRSPSGRSASSSAPGLQAEAGLAVNNEQGTFASTTTGTFFCPVFHGIAGFGFGFNINAKFVTAYFTNPTVSSDDHCIYHATACLAGTKATCTSPGAITFVPGCPAYIRVVSLYLTWNSSSLCTEGVAQSWPGPGGCS